MTLVKSKRRLSSSQNFVCLKHDNTYALLREMAEIYGAVSAISVSKRLDNTATNSTVSNTAVFVNSANLP